MRRQFVPSTFEKLQGATGMGRINSARKKPAGLHHLMPGIMDRGGRMVTGTNEREFISELGVQGKDLGNLYIGIVRLDRLERPADFGRGIGLHVEGIDLAGRSEVEDHDARFLVVAGTCCAESLESGKF